MLTAALFILAKRWKTTQIKCLSTNEWINKMWYTYNGILFSKTKQKQKMKF